MGADIYFPEGVASRPWDDCHRSAQKLCTLMQNFNVLPVAIPESGDNFMFDGTSLLIKNVTENRWFKLLVTGSAGLEQLDYSTEVVGPTPAPVTVSGDNFEFADGDILKWGHDTDPTFFRFDWFDDGGGFQIGAADASDPAASAAVSGVNYRFLASRLQFRDINSLVYYTPVLVGAVAEQQFSHL